MEKKETFAATQKPGLANSVVGNRLTEHGDHHLTCAPVAPPGFGDLFLNVWGRSWAVYCRACFAGLMYGGEHMVSNT